jgi:hypothetical protein
MAEQSDIFAKLFRAMFGNQTGVESLFGEQATGDTAAAAGIQAPNVPSVPIERLVGSPMRNKGRGLRDTILTGSAAGIEVNKKP